MDDIKLEELEKVCRNESHKVRARMVAVRVVLVPDMADTTPARRYTEGCKPTQVCHDNAAFSGSARMMPPDSR